MFTMYFLFVQNILSFIYIQVVEVLMFNKEKIIEILNSEDLFIDNFILDAFIKNWKIEPIYEDANGIEFFDEMAVEKIRNGIKQKEPKNEINIMNKDDITPVDMTVEIPETPQEEGKEFVREIAETQIIPPQENGEQTQNFQDPQELPVAVLNEVNREVENELKNVTLDISNQTLAVLAESIARKITSDVADYIKQTDFIEDAVQLGEYKKDNQILVNKLEEILSDNKILIKRIEELEKERNSFVKLFGNIYVKNR